MNIRTSLWNASLLPRGSGDSDDLVWKYLPIWIGVAFALRAIIALGGDFVYSPVATMSYLEPAHRAAFGYGVDIYEWKYGIRNWIVPGFIASILWSLDKVGLGVPWVYVYVVKLAFCVLSLLIPWGSYHITRRTLGEDSARMAVIITSLWPYLVVFANMPLPVLVSTSLLFGALGLACRPVSNNRKGALTFGAILALSCAVRVHYLPAAGLIWLARVMGSGRSWTVTSVVGGLIMVALVGLLETFTYGIPFYSYYMYLQINLYIHASLTVTEWHYYITTLLYATAGGVIIMCYAVFRYPRRYLLFIGIIVATMTLHQYYSFKSFRFILLVLPLCLIVMADQLCIWQESFPRIFNHKAVAVMTATFFVLVIGDVFNENWIKHTAGKDTDPNFIGRKSQIDIFMNLARLDNVQGVLHIGPNLIESPGYYYLHHSVPLYDMESFLLEVAKTGISDPKKLVSHVVSSSSLLDMPGFVKIASYDDGYIYGTFEGAEVINNWDSYTPLAATLSDRIFNEFGYKALR